ncbi:MAG: SulP family inorganic anion transporter [Steroidobacteraceae bacterium]
MNTPQSQGSAIWHLFVPKLFTVLRQGYGLGNFRHDLIAGLTVAIVALPLAMALAIASGTTPDKGLITAVIAGFLISALGGSRFSIGGPTGAFVVVVYNVIDKFGYDGLLIATLMAGALLIMAGLARLGTWIKYIPEPVVTGFTSGIAVIIFSSQVKDFFGLSMDKVPAGFLEQWSAYWQHFNGVDAKVLAVSSASLALILLLRRYAPKQPGFLYAIAASALAVWLLKLPVPTIGSRFGAISASLPAPSLPTVSWDELKLLFPSAFTIAFLAGVESLLCAMVADGMTGRRHRSNCELVAQGIANLGSALFGGLPATGAIARTATNIRAGAFSPVAGILHAILLLIFMLALSGLIAYVPLASLAAVLFMVAWNMSEQERFRHLLRAPLGDRVVLLLTFALTVLVDLTVAIEVGVVLAAVLFMHRMAEAVAIQTHQSLIENDQDDFTRGKERSADPRAQIPKDVQVLELHGPFFFGVASRLSEVLDRVGKSPRLFILQMNRVPLIDATGIGALKELLKRCERDRTRMILCELQPAVRETLEQMELLADQRLTVCGSLAEALQYRP